MHKTQCIECQDYVFSTLMENDLCPSCVSARYTQQLRESSAKKLREENAAAKNTEHELQQAALAEVARREEIKAERAERRKELAAAHAAEEQEKETELKALASQDDWNAKAEARKVLARRELARRRYLPFVQQMVPGFSPGWVHKDLCERLERFSEQVANKESPRLMISMPPRAGKSESGPKTFPAWHLGHYPQHEIIACAYASALAFSFSRACRQKMRSKDYQAIFPKTKIDQDAQGVENWLTTDGGGYLAAGVGGPVTGKGAHILMIDDPVKNAEEAESPTVREAIKEWYQSTAYTRLAPGGGVLIIQTRWHDDDLSGWLNGLADANEGDKFEQVVYPAIAEEDERYRKKGEALHPERYDEKAYARIRRAVGEKVWQALYQQNPVPSDGAYFSKSWFRFYDPKEKPEKLVYFDAWDLAIGLKQQNDWSVGLKCGIDQQGKMWLIECRRGKWNSMELVEQILDLQRMPEYESSMVGIEKGQIEMSIGPFLRKRIQELRQYSFNLVDLKTGRADKMARARSIQGRTQQGMVLFPALGHAGWVGDFTQELLRFPAGTWDDQVDAFAWLGIMLDKYYSHAMKTIKKKSWRDELKKYVNRGTTEKSFLTS